MGKIGCSINGTLDDSKFNEPMPWIGIYVAAASAACAVAMAIDVFRGFSYRKFWFPCKFFSLNATTLTLISVAIKLAVDLNTSMPRPHDQLAKLSSTTFICTAIGNFLPSLGTMGNQELMMNVVALGILVITVIVNIGIQLGTGVIYVFWKEHAIIMFLMVILFALLVSSALTIPSTKSFFDLKYRKKYKLAMKECDNNANPYVPEKLRDDLTRYWMMANTCNPQFVIGRMATCTASGAFCLLSAVTLTEAMLRNYLTPWCFKFCEGDSDYKWSTTLIFVTQAIAVGVGTLAPASRWFISIKFRCLKRNQKNYKAEFAVENYWIRKLYEWRDCPINYRIFSRNGRKIMYVTKNKVLNLSIWIQKAMVLLSKSVRLISILFMSRLLIIIQCSKKLICLAIFNETVSKSHSWPKLDLRNFVMYLEGEEELIDIVTESERDATGHWIRMGKKKQPRNLVKFLEKLNGFEGVKKFDSDQVSSLDSEEPPYCWALPVVTLTSIAVAIGNRNFDLVKELIHSVHQGLEYIRVIENNQNTKGDTLINSRHAAEIVWVGIDLHYRWLDVDLREMGMEGKSSRDIISELSDAAKHRFTELRKNDALSFLRDPSRWPNKVLAANSMYRTCQTLVLNLDNRGSECLCREKMFEVVSGMIADVIGACLTNLPRVISMTCHRSAIEEREQTVRNSILLLGKTEKILEILNGKPLPELDPDEMASIDEWRALTRKNDHHPCGDSSSGNCDLELLSSSPDFYLNIE